MGRRAGNGSISSLKSDVEGFNAVDSIPDVRIGRDARSQGINRKLVR